MEILHIAPLADWQSAEKTGSYHVSSRGASLDQIGFIHACLPDQLAAVAETFYADDPEELVILVLDDELIRRSGVEVRFEDGGSGELYPHIYGSIDPAWVGETRLTTRATIEP